VDDAARFGSERHDLGGDGYRTTPENVACSVVHGRATTHSLGRCPYGRFCPVHVWPVLRCPPREALRATRYVSWEDLAGLLMQLTRSNSPRERILSADLLEYLREHRMVKNRKSVEIYAREINEPVTRALFLRAQVYGCRYQPGSPIAEALYFAPHFGRRIAKGHPGVAIGISYVARIEPVGRATTWREFQDLMLENRGRTWWKQCQDELKALRRRWRWGTEQRTFLLLGEPRRFSTRPCAKKDCRRAGVG
jgi:hypothetical protein